jgi:hypothetical protein
VISLKASDTIFTSLGYAGQPVERKVVRKAGKLQVELYPKQVVFELISARQLTMTKRKKDESMGYECLDMPPA